MLPDSLAYYFAGIGRGTCPSYTGYWPDISPGSEPLRIRARTFFGEGADVSGNFAGSQNSIVPSSAEGANWAVRDSQTLSVADTGLLALTGFSRSSDQTSAPTACIGVAGFTINNKVNGLAWGLYSDLQHEAGARFSAGLEIAAKNKGANLKDTPYGATQGGVYGIWAAGGGDPVYGGSPTNPSNAACVILRNGQSWNTGILFKNNALTSEGTLFNAVWMPANYALRWDKEDGTAAARIYSQITAPGIAYRLIFTNNAAQFTGPSAEPVFSATHVPNSVNHIRVFNAAAGGTPIMEVIGSDPSADLWLSPKGGAGRLRFGPYAAEPAPVITGYIEIKDHNGTPRKLAVLA